MFNIDKYMDARIMHHAIVILGVLYFHFIQDVKVSACMAVTVTYNVQLTVRTIRVT